MRLRQISLTLLVLAFPALVQAQTTEIAQRPAVRGHLWISDGLAGIFSSNSSAGSRFRVGADLHIGSDYQFILGWTLFDRIWSGETSPSVGEISRRASDLSFGYFIVPDSLWLMYSLHIEDLSGSTATGSITAFGHQFSIGRRILTRDNFNLALEGMYLFVPLSSAAAGGTNFPLANIWNLSVRIGLDLGGQSR